MANYKARKRKGQPLRSCKMCKTHKFWGNSVKRLKIKDLKQRNRSIEQIKEES